MATEIIPQLPEWTASKIPLYRIRCHVIAENTAEVPIFRTFPLISMLYNIVEDENAVRADELHNQNAIKPWSFAPIIFEKYQKTEIKGVYRIDAATKGVFNIVTTDPIIKDALIHAPTLHFNKLTMKTERVQVSDDSYGVPPESFSTITIRLHSPTFWIVNKHQYRDITAERFLTAQLYKLKALGYVTTFDASALVPYIRLLRDDTTEHSMHIDDRIWYKGKMGHVTFKISGNDDIKAVLYDICHISQYIGIGSRTSSGFGHNTIYSVK